MYNSRQQTLLGVENALIFITVAVVAIRIYSRGWLSRTFGTDDVLMVIATAFAIAFTVITSVHLNYGWGISIYSPEQDPAWLGPSRKVLWSSQLCFVICTTLSKISILTFYLRIFDTTNRKFRNLVYLGLSLVSSIGVAFILVVIFQCRPVQAYWDPSLGRNCLRTTTPYLVNWALNTFTDFYVFLLPIKSVWDLQLPRRQKIGLLIVFAGGLVVCITGAVRIACIVAVFALQSDYTWIGTDLWIVTAAELDLGIICASVPALKAFLARFFPRLLHRPIISKSVQSISSRSYPMNSMAVGSTHVRKWTESEEFIITIGMGSIGPEMAKEHRDQAQERSMG
ncbi:hypothetical protein L873DRAFT_1680359 [Choiromyces venosus 120613-1]|uniref:Rhodopsin domain-containing protein n=1 Tax=Choiromyces venosus 120613-1 TaxID=1336337 RepID=A0A3N4JQD8_9PEZI|nr:hypothetical protein L873DRAFT_1680359 [Choiromyces venosus 120613-1]